jgi:hypothetical protein
MISIVGFLKLDSTKPERLNYLIATIKSFYFIKNVEFIIALDSPTKEETNKVIKELKDSNVEYLFKAINNYTDYGKVYCDLLKEAKYHFVLNLIEDHFCICDDIQYITNLLITMDKYDASICKATFNQIELNSSHTITPIYNDEEFFVFDNNQQNHTEYEKFYKSRYYIGVNFITTKSFALNFWNRLLGKRPHEYEISPYNENWKHICLIPKKEILASIDDAHGEAGTELLSRNDEKFKKIYDTVI